MHLYSAFLCIVVHPKRFTIMWGGGGGEGGGGLSSTTTSVQHPLGWCDGCHRTTAPVRSPHTRYRWRGERVIETIKWIGIIRRPWLTRASGGNLTRTLGLHLYSTRIAMRFLMTTESQDLGLTSHPKDGCKQKGNIWLHKWSLRWTCSFKGARELQKGSWTPKVGRTSKMGRDLFTQRLSPLALASANCYWFTFQNNTL